MILKKGTKVLVYGIGHRVLIRDIKVESPTRSSVTPECIWVIYYSFDTSRFALLVKGNVLDKEIYDP